jgi:hypothetical protein
MNASTVSNDEHSSLLINNDPLASDGIADINTTSQLSVDDSAGNGRNDDSFDEEEEDDKADNEAARKAAATRLANTFRVKGFYQMNRQDKKCLFPMLVGTPHYPGIWFDKGPFKNLDKTSFKPIKSLDQSWCKKLILSDLIVKLGCREAQIVRSGGRITDRNIKKLPICVTYSLQV